VAKRVNVAFTIWRRNGMMGKKMLENIWPTAWDPWPISATAIWIL